MTPLMRILRIALALLLWGTAALAAPPAAGRAAEARAGRGEAADPFFRGMAFGLFSRGDSAYIREQLDEMRGLGVDSVSLVVPKATPDIRSLTFVDDRWATPGDGALRIAARLAHERGMRVLLFPLVHVQTLDAGEWRGTLQPSDWGEWFRAYGEFLVHYARLAEAESIEVLSVGSELCSSEAREDDWRRLIARVREVYHGRVVYSANWDHYRDVRFWDALDYLGVNAYFRLSGAAEPTVAELTAGWTGHRDALISWARRERRPLLITEVGYPSRSGAADDPWDYTADRPADLELQRRCYRAFVDAWSGVRELRGAFFYLWWGEGGAGDKDYTPRGKPAAAELARWFGASARDGRADLGTARKEDR
jgi:glycosyl hydrolase family 113